MCPCGRPLTPGTLFSILSFLEFFIVVVYGDVVTLVEDLVAVLAKTSPSAGVVVDLEGCVGGPLQQVAHGVAVRGKKEARCEWTRWKHLYFTK